MCSICGEVNFLEPGIINYGAIEKMNSVLKHRGPDESDIFTDNYACLGHNRLSVVDIENGHQPMSILYGNKKYTIVYNGEIYNCDEIKKELKRKRIYLKTNCDTEVVLYSYILYGQDCVNHLNGIFAFAIYDGESVFCARDRFGVKPFYYSYKGGSLIFASELKAMLTRSEIKHEIDRYGLWEILYLSPNFVSGKSVFRDVLELEPAECMLFSKSGLKKRRYWSVVAQPFFKNKSYAVEKTRYLLTDAIKRQLGADVGLCVLLSGGLDSSVVTAVANEDYKSKGKILDTYSFEYEG